MFKTLGTIILLSTCLSSPSVKNGDVKRAYNTGTYISTIIDSSYSVKATAQFWQDYNPSSYTTAITSAFSGDFLLYNNNHYDYMFITYENYNSANVFGVYFQNEGESAFRLYRSNLDNDEYTLNIRYRGYATSLTESEWQYITHSTYSDYRVYTFSNILSVFNSGYLNYQLSSDTFNFNKPFNVNQPNIVREGSETFFTNYYYNYVIETGETQTDGVIVSKSFDVPLFNFSGSHYVYNRITYHYVYSSTVKYVEKYQFNDVAQSGEYEYWTIKSMNNKQLFFTSAYYEYYDGDSVVHSTLMCSRQYDVVDGVSNVIGASVIFASVEWDDDSDSDILDVDTRRLQFFNTDSNINNTLMNIGLIDTTVIPSGGSGSYMDNFALTSAFALIATAFSGLTSLLGWAILPSITLGTLLLVPFAIAVLLFIIKLFKR